MISIPLARWPCCLNWQQRSIAAGVLGLLQRSPEAFLKGGDVGSAGEDADIEADIEKRAQAKRDKNFALADDIRKSLLARGIVLEDRPGGVTQWRRQ